MPPCAAEYPLIHQELTTKTFRRFFAFRNTVKMWKTVALYEQYLIIVHNKPGAEIPPLDAELDKPGKLLEYDQAGDQWLLEDEEVTRISAMRVLHPPSRRTRFFVYTTSEPLFFEVLGPPCEVWESRFQARFGDKLVIREEAAGAQHAAFWVLLCFFVLVAAACANLLRQYSLSDVFGRFDDLSGPLVFLIAGVVSLGGKKVLASVWLRRQWGSARSSQTKAVARRSTPVKPFRSKWVGQCLRFASWLASSIGVYIAFFMPRFARLPEAIRTLIYLGLALAAYSLARWSKRIGTPSAEELMRLDPRPPILFLRSFVADRQTKTDYGAEELDADKALDPLHFLIGGKASMSDAKGAVAELGERLHRVEEEISPLVAKYGPFVAIGRPGERIMPLGAARMYVPDSQWKSAVMELIKAAQLIVWQAGDTENAWWELGEAVCCTDPHHLIMCIPNPQSRHVSYEAVRQRSAHVLPVPLPQSIGCANAVVFDEAWKPQLTNLATAFRQHSWDPKHLAAQNSGGELAGRRPLWRRPKLWGAVFIALLIVRGCGPGTQYALTRAIRNSDAAEIRRTLAWSDRPRSKPNETPWLHAIDWGRYAVAIIVSDNSADVRAADDKGRTPLHIAAIAAGPEIVALLIERGADPNAPDKDGDTPLHYAAMANKPEIMNLLIQSGARDVVDNAHRHPREFLPSPPVSER